ncbi:MAG: PQQ-binding-like beta-propeller repeat protein [Planctomycetes bacterium]|nr:PQQ-binding-like beta-propeller repeat protein [Planctomycetota bacterium]
MRRVFETVRVNPPPAPEVPRSARLRVLVCALLAETDPKVLVSIWERCESLAGRDSSDLFLSLGSPLPAFTLFLRVIDAHVRGGLTIHRKRGMLVNLLTELDFPLGAAEDFADRVAEGNRDPIPCLRSAEALDVAGDDEAAGLEYLKAALLTPEDTATWTRLADSARRSGHGRLLRLALRERRARRPPGEGPSGDVENPPPDGYGETPADASKGTRVLWTRDDTAQAWPVQISPDVLCRIRVKREDPFGLSLEAMETHTGKTLWTTLSPMPEASPIERDIPGAEVLPWQEIVGVVAEAGRVCVALSYMDQIQDRGRCSYVPRYADCMAFDASSGKELWRNRVEDGGCPQHLVSAGDLLLVNCPCHVHALDARDGSLRWSRFLATQLVGPPTRFGDAIIVPAREPRAYVLSSADGSIVGEIPLPAPCARGVPPVAVNDAIALATESVEVCGFDPVTLSLRWRYAPPRQTGYWCPSTHVCRLGAVNGRCFLLLLDEASVLAFDPPSVIRPAPGASEPLPADLTAIWDRHIGIATPWNLQAHPDALLLWGPDSPLIALHPMDGSLLFTLPIAVACDVIKTPSHLVIGEAEVAHFWDPCKGALASLENRLGGFRYDGGQHREFRLACHRSICPSAVSERLSLVLRVAESMARSGDYAAACETAGVACDLIDPWSIMARRKRAEWAREVAAADPSHEVHWKALSARQWLRLIDRADPLGPDAMRARESLSGFAFDLPLSDNARNCLTGTLSTRFSLAAIQSRLAAGEGAPPLPREVFDCLRDPPRELQSSDVLPLLDSSDPEVRGAAFAMLARRGVTMAHRSILSAAEAPQPTTRALAAQRLGSMTGEEPGPPGPALHERGRCGPVAHQRPIG